VIPSSDEVDVLGGTRRTHSVRLRALWTTRPAGEAVLQI
jgi:hypothetical protein